MITFSNLKHHELFEIQSDIKIICDLQKNDYLKDYLKDLEENEIEEILYYKRLFEDIYKDFQDLGI